MRFLRLLEGAFRVIERLYRHLVRGKVIFLAVMRGRDPVSMGGPIVHLSSYLMCVHRHNGSPYESFRRSERAMSAMRRPCNRAASSASGPGMGGTVTKPARHSAA